jgi:GNAT superfamily N-acetyltransferase
LVIRRLEQGDEREHFDCGDEPLNTYLKRYARQHQEKQLLGVTHVAVHDDNPRYIIGYYTLATSSIPIESLPGDVTSHLPFYVAIPVVLLARLAVHRDFEHQGIGPQLLANALERCREIGIHAGCRYLIVDAYPHRVSWYSKYGFVLIEGAEATAKTRKMFLDLQTVEKARQVVLPQTSG